MKAAVLREVNSPLTIEDVKIDKPGPKEVLIRTCATGVCHSDLHLANGSWRTPLPVILGHESSGIVEQIGSDVRHVKPGDHVITCISSHCGHCEECLTGHMYMCLSPEDSRPEADGARLWKDDSADSIIHQQANLSGYAEQMLVPHSTVTAIRRDMPLDVAALIGCAVTTGAGAVLNTAQVGFGDTVAVIGCGGIGLCAINAAYIAGASRIIAIDTRKSKLSLAREFGATDVVDSATDDPVEQVRELTGGGVNYSFEAVGLKETAEQAFKMLRSRGVATIIGMIKPSVRLELRGADFLNERCLQGSAMGSNRFPVDMQRFVEFYMQGRLHLDKLISRRIKLDQINEAFDDLESGNVARSIIVFDT
ncbi:Zn-dependent alcohol dehydrogenase [Kineobactrum salinum]|uniref:Zn-dependent alcohol dehydrogenase n=1 Tax=Kineobactrum salinum TaxID=2708301 RepID=A0A6C0TZ13_9GAMM|nr:Zn-dependent alcohol dehydrogenase [Kineobactrum salinum]QIB65060.1 Zn-dependent alcohol dehydrogenase [Kineobactrum salinum]